MKRLSVIIPVFNEEKTIEEIVPDGLNWFEHVSTGFMVKDGQVQWNPRHKWPTSCADRSVEQLNEPLKSDCTRQNAFDVQMAPISYAMPIVPPSSSLPVNNCATSRAIPPCWLSQWDRN